MKKRIAYILLLALLPLAGHAQQPKKVTQKFFSDPDVEMDIPVFHKKSGYTTHKEMLEFIGERAAEHPGLISVEIVGQSQRGRDIPLVTVSTGNAKNKLRIFYYARVHGDEPAGTEGMLYLTRQLAEDAEVQAMLDRAVFYIMPMVNPDGAESFKRQTANGIDLNRDQSKLDTPEAVALHAVVTRIEPHVAVDFHEYQSIRSDFSKLTSDIISTPWDVMFLYSGNPNVPQTIRNVVDELFVPNAGADMDRWGYTHHTYFTSRSSNNDVVFNVGGASPRSTSNAFALKGMISLLMEIRGIKLDRVSMKRRTHTAYELGLSFARTAIENEARLRAALNEARRDDSDVAVKFSAERAVMEFPFLDIIRNEMTVLEVPARVNTNCTPTLTRSLPEAYYILPSEKAAIEKLEKMGIEYTVLACDEQVEVEAFTVLTAKEDSEQVGGVYPIDITTRIESKTVTLPTGTVRVGMGQQYRRAATVLLEPESSNGFVNYRVIQASRGLELPVYRSITAK